MGCFISKNQVSEILNLFEFYKNTAKVANELNLSLKTVKRYLRLNNIEFKTCEKRIFPSLTQFKDDIEKRYNNGESANSIAFSFGYKKSEAIIKFLKKNKIKTRTKKEMSYTVNEKFFDKIDTEVKAYILGFIMSDGHTSSDGNYVRLAITDLDILERIAKEIGWSGKITSKKPRSNNHKTIYRMNIGSRYMNKSLLRVGCVHRKTYFGKFQNEEQVPTHLIPHLIRGWIDSDGCITCSFNKKLRSNIWYAGIVGNNEVCNGIQAAIKNAIGFGGNISRNKNRNQNFASLRIGGHNQLKAFLDWIYKDSTIYLDRKYQKYLQFKKEYNDSKKKKEENLETTKQKSGKEEEGFDVS